MKRLLLVLVLVAAAGAALFWFLTDPARQTAGLEPIPPGPANLENGHLLFLAGGCSSCHATPGQDDKTRLGGGFALESPYGTFHAPNISPHKRDGIGGWTPEQFLRAMRAGVSPEGSHYYPAFPYTSYQRMSAADVRDLFAYLGTLPAVEGRAPPHTLGFPFNIRRGLGLWKLVYLDGQVFRPDPGKSASLNRGAYLVEGPGHCAECHSPRNRLGGIVEQWRFAGGPNPDGRGSVPNITPDETGIKGWSVGDVADLLSSGMTPEGDFVGGNMGSVVRNTAGLPDSDRRAIGEYLLSLPPKPEQRPAKPADKPAS